MKNSWLLLFIFFQISIVKAQSITGIIAQGASATSTNGVWSLEWDDNEDTTSKIVKEITLTLSGSTNGKKLIFDASNASADWQIQFGSRNSKAWKTFCQETPGLGSNKTDYTFSIRDLSTSLGTHTNTIYVGFGNNCNNGFTPLVTINISVNVTDKKVYTWEGRSGIDSFYDTDENWYPVRTNPNVNDILVVDLGSSTNKVNTTIDISGVSENIGQFKIYPYNHVDFKCTTDANWTVGRPSSLSGVDFNVSLNSDIRKTGAGELEIIVPANNSLDIDGSITTLAGDLLFSGAGTHNISGNINTLGGLLNFTPSSGTNTLYLDGSKQVLSGNSYVSGTPTLYIDTNFNVTVGTASTSPVDTLTLQRTLPIYSVVTLSPGTRIISNNPASSSESDWNAWEPYFQLKAPQFNQAVKRGQLNVVPTSSEIVGGSLFEIYGTNVRAYRMIGLPFANGVHLSQFSDDIDLTGTLNGTTNKDSFETSCSVCKTSAFYWNESSGSWNAYVSGATANILPKGNGSLIFFRGRKSNGLGDTGATANEGIIDFKGKLQVGNYTHTLTKSSGSGALTGFNLVANPYPSNITFDEVYSKHKGRVKPRYRTYDARRKTYNIWDSTVQNSPGKSGARKFASSSNQQAKIIAAGAAFFIEAEANNETISFTESMKTPFTEATTAQHGVQELNETPCNHLLVNLAYRSDTLFDSDNVTIQFDIENPTVTHNATETDVVEFYAGYLGIGTLSPEGTWLTIDRRPKMAEINESYTLPLKTVYPKDALKQMVMDFNYCTEEQSNYQILLIDKVKNTSTEVKDLMSYSFEISSSEEKRDNRFELLFTGIEKQNSTENLSHTSLSIFPNPSDNGEFFIANPQNHAINTLQILDQSGKIVLESSIESKQSLIHMNIETLKSGWYILRINSLTNSENHPIIIK